MKAGWNTDAPAALDVLGGPELVRDRSVLILGGGDTTISIGLALADAGARVAVAARRPARASKTVSRHGWPISGWAGRHEIRHDILVNCTPLGGDGVQSPWEDGRPLTARVVLDLALTGMQTTPLVERARADGLVAMDGLDFWCHQGARQMSILTGRPISPDMLARELGRVIQDREGAASNS